MMETITYDFEFSVGILLLRITAGVLFFFQGYDKLFNLGTGKVLDTVADPMKRTLVPLAALKPMVVLSSWVELLGGLFLAFGLFRSYALMALSADLVVVAVVFSSMNAMWDMRFYSPRFAMVAALLLLPSASDCFTIDALITGK